MPAKIMNDYNEENIGLYNTSIQIPFNALNNCLDLFNFSYFLLYTLHILGLEN